MFKQSCLLVRDVTRYLITDAILLGKMFYLLVGILLLAGGLIAIMAGVVAYFFKTSLIAVSGYGAASVLAGIVLVEIEKRFFPWTKHEQV